MKIGLRANLHRAAPAEMPVDRLMDWIHAFHGLLQSAAGSDDFYVKAARALVELVNLDSGRVLFVAESGWQEKARHIRASAKGPAECPPSTRVLASVRSAKRTFWQAPELGASTWGLEAVVAAPILDRMGTVIGALYGERRQIGAAVQEPITQLEAMLVEVLARGVAAGLARLEQERVALRTQLQMEQFFTPRLAGRLQDHPELLDGRDCNISVLFCDVRGFSRITHQLGPRRTVEMMSDIMSELTQCVLDEEGVVVDYVGDEVMAMWGAPEEQPDHGARACRAGLSMLRTLPMLNRRWHTIVDQPLQLGIGINSGAAQVGNVGSRMKFKYGPLGNAVNLASRVQGATKVLKVPLLITSAAHVALSESFATRRLCQVRLHNIAEPVMLFELVDTGAIGWESLKGGYEQALQNFCLGEFRQACRILGRLIPDHPEDGPSLLLLSRAVDCLVKSPEVFDPVLVMEGK